MISNPSLNVEIDECSFEKHYGINTMSGGAISINGKQGDTYAIIGKESKQLAKMGKVSITNSKLDQNYAGVLASGVNLINIKTSLIELKNLTLTNNTGSFSVFEEYHSLPFFDILTMGKYKLNYISHAESWNEEYCTDEI